MASKLVNLHKTLTWKDFAPQDFPVPSPGQTVDVALTAANAQVSGVYVEQAKKGAPFKIRDSIVVTIVFDTGNSWVAKWVFDKPQDFQDNLLVHEQGHYNIVALLARDLYNALVALRAKSFATSDEAQSAMEAEQQRLSGKSQPTSDRYDTDTKNGTDAAQQAAWNGYISNAFAQSGTEFLTLLSQAGINI